MAEQYRDRVDGVELLSDLDADQRRAVTTDSRLVAVVAGAGSGKTRVLTRRVAYRVATGSADPGHTLVLTFTREAAGELRRRLPRLGLTERLTAGTFHSVAHGVLRQRWLDLDQRPRTLSTDRQRIVRDIMGPADLESLVAEMNWASARGLDGTGYAQAVRHGDRRSQLDTSRVEEALTRYRSEKRSRGVIDLDDLLLLTIEELERDAEFADALRWRFRHLHVDEAQDLNPLQHRLVDLLRQGNDDLFMVGDPAQAIYAFNGSDPDLLANVSDRFPGIEIIRLPVNHRCTPQIVAAGSAALLADGQPIDAVSARPDGPVVEVTVSGDESAEAAHIAQQIARADPALVRSGDVAVLARTHAALAPVRDALATHGVAVRRIVDGAGSPLAPYLREAFRIPDAHQMRRWTQNSVERASEDVAAGQPNPALHEVAQAAVEFLREQPTGDGAAFRTWITATDPFGQATPGVDVLTFHAAKGREWHSVWLVGCETSLVPHRSATTNAAKREEARLLYVALTRATDQLTISWAERRGGYQRRFTPLLSDFSSETPPTIAPPTELLRHRDPNRHAVHDRLLAWRDNAARVAGILPDAICSDRSLRKIAEQRPASAEELDALTGFGLFTARRHFPRIAEALAPVDRAQAPGHT